MAKDIGRFNNDIRMACGAFGDQHVFWPKDASYVKIDQFPLPGNFRYPRTNIIIIIPENYGYGGCFRDIFLDPDLELLDKDGRSFRRLSGDIHGFRKYPYSSMSDGMKEIFVRRNWFYLCLHDKDSKSCIVNYLYKVNLFLANPYKDWKAIENGYAI